MLKEDNISHPGLIRFFRRESLTYIHMNFNEMLNIFEDNKDKSIYRDLFSNKHNLDGDNNTYNKVLFIFNDIT